MVLKSFVRVTKIEDLEKFYLVIKELRTELSYDEFVEIYKMSHIANEYEVVGYEIDNQMVAAMGFRILYDLVHGKHLYIDDLVVSERFRSHGLGAELLKHAEEVAKQKNCKGLRLCTGVDNSRAKIFYEKNGWSLRSVAYKKKVG